MIVMIDNYDSFTYNLVQEMGKLGATMDVHRNDKITIDELEALNPTALIISPGPCSPTEAGISVEAIQRFSGRLPLFGVCLGHQSIVQAFGGKVIHAQRIMHGKTSPMTHNNEGLFAGLDQPFIGGRYHSLAGERPTLPDEPKMRSLASAACRNLENDILPRLQDKFAQARVRDVRILVQTTC